MNSSLYNSYIKNSTKYLNTENKKYKWPTFQEIKKNISIHHIYNYGLKLCNLFFHQVLEFFSFLIPIFIFIFSLVPYISPVFHSFFLILENLDPLSIIIISIISIANLIADIIHTKKK